jgi:hypothetical protein
MSRWIVAALLVVAACHKDPGPPCPQVVDHMLDVMKTGLAGHGSLQLGNRKLMIEHCEKAGFTAAARSCIVAAKDMNGLAQCKDLEPAAPAEPQRRPRPPRPLVGSGSAGSGNAGSGNAGSGSAGSGSATP